MTGSAAVRCGCGATAATARHRSLRVELQRPGQQPAGRRREDSVRAGSLSATARDLGRDTRRRAGRHRLRSGRAAGADVVRVLWPSGILQAETLHDGGRNRAGDAASPFVDRRARSQALVVSVPLHVERRALRVRHRFPGRRRDGLLGRPGQVRHTPDPVEYVRIRGDNLRPKERPLRPARHQRARRGAVRRSLQLLAIAHPRDIEVFPNEGMTDPPKPFRLQRFATAASTARASTTTATTSPIASRGSIGGIRTTSRSSRSAATRPHTRLTLDLGPSGRTG